MPNEYNQLVPDTSALTSLLNELYPNESQQLITDFANSESQKYPGHTRFQEYMRDAFLLSDSSMQTLQVFSNGGRCRFPLCAGEHQRSVCRSFRQDPDRGVLQQKIEDANYVLNDPDAAESEKQTARTTLRDINIRLGRVQKGLDVDWKDAQEQRLRPQKELEAENVEAMTRYEATTITLLAGVEEEIGNALSSFGGEAAGVQATALAQLVETALSDNSVYADRSRKRLAEQGISRFRQRQTPAQSAL